MKLRMVFAEMEFEAEGSEDAIRAGLELVVQMLNPPPEVTEEPPPRPRRRRRKVIP